MHIPLFTPDFGGLLSYISLKVKAPFLKSGNLTIFFSKEIKQRKNLNFFSSYT
tara:strand:+ start:120 stop:278 length:159 start_codon:yes stop_codon:yes gene_type:complete